MKPGLSAVIAVRDEANMLVGCLRRLKFVDEIVVVIDDRTKDSSAEVAQEAGAKVIHHKFKTYSDIKNAGIKAASHQWVFIIDADERVPKSSAALMLSAIQDQSVDGYDMPWDNYFLGRLMRHGGWQEKHIRLFQNGAADYQGDIHEDFIFRSPNPVIKNLDAPIAHFSHRSIIHNLEKTGANASLQAQELKSKNYPPLRARSFFGIFWRELYFRLVKKRGYKDGVPGVIEGMYQACSWFIIYARLWELQQKPSLDEQYKLLEDSIDA